MAKMLLFSILLLGITSVVYVNYSDAIDFDSINYGVQADISGNNIINVTCSTPTNGTTASWYSVTNGQVKVGINITASVGTEMTVYYYNRTSGYYLVNTTYYTKGDSGPIDDYFIWTGLSNLTNYKWSVNISVNESAETWNMTGWWNFTTPEFISPTTFNSINYGVSANLTEEPPGPSWTVYDSVTYGVQANLSTGGTGTSENSTWWEFYKLDNRYDVNVDTNVNVYDITETYTHFGESPFPYLYDVYPECTGDDVLNVYDLSQIYSEIS